MWKINWLKRENWIIAKNIGYWFRIENGWYEERICLEVIRNPIAQEWDLTKKIKFLSFVIGC